MLGETTCADAVAVGYGDQEPSRGPSTKYVQEVGGQNDSH
jgi:hypothetical protein